MTPVLPPPDQWDCLVSFHYHRRPDQMTAVVDLARRGARFIGDSGAYSAHTQGVSVTVDNFTPWVHAYQRHLSWVASLDVLNNPAGSWDNYQALKSNGVSNLVPTVHLGTPPNELDRYVEDGATLVGLGGAVGAPAVKATRWYVECMRYARRNHPHLRFHGWGVTRPQVVRDLPFWSVDSSGFSSGFRFGRLSIVDPDTGRMSYPRLDGHSSSKFSREMVSQYGVHPSEIPKSNASNRPAMVQMALGASITQTKFLSARHRVSPPGLLSPTEVMGTRVHFADSAHSTWQYLLAATLTTQADV